MTPEERAAKLVAHTKGDYYYEGMAHENDIAAAIRAAVAETIELIAKMADDRCEPYFDGFAYELRSMKL